MLKKKINNPIIIVKKPCSLVTRRDTLLMETGVLHKIFWNFSTRGERYYFTRGEPLVHGLGPNGSEILK